MQHHDILVVILNYRTAELVVQGLQALRTEVRSLGRAKVVVVDGGSHDGSADTIDAAIRDNEWSDWCELLALEDNRGFAAGNNAAIRRALETLDPPEFVLLLNPDTQVRPGAIKSLVSYLEENPTVGIAGSRLEDPDGTPQISAFGFPSVTSELLDGLKLGVAERFLSDRLVQQPIPDRSGPVDWVAGASMMIRRSVFASVGLMDEGFFLYFEEVDFCLRALKAGWPTHYVPASRVVHYVGQATGVSDERRTRRRMPKYWFASRERYFMRHFGRPKRTLADLAFTAGFTSFRLRQRLQRKVDREPPRLLRDFVHYNFAPEYEAPQQPHGPSRGGRPPLAERGRWNENPPDLGLLSLLREDFETYDRNPWEQGLWAIVVHRLGNSRMSIRCLPVRAPLSVAYRFGAKAVEIGTGITLPYTVRVGRRVRIWHHGSTILHADTIGDDVTIRHNTTFGVVRTSDLEALPVIGDGVDLGVGTSVLGAVKIGDHAVVGAHALVLRDVMPGTTVAGVPAKPMGPSRTLAAIDAPDSRDARSA